jgi:hypothetical protein
MAIKGLTITANRMATADGMVSEVTTTTRVVTITTERVQGW